MKTYPTISHITLLTIVSLFISLTGCKVVGPDFEKPSTDLPDEYYYQQDSIMNDTNVRMLFDDERLQNFIDSALAQNKNLEVAISRIEQAKYQLGITKTQALPQFNYNGNLNLGNDTDKNTQLGAGANASVSWELDLWGKFKRGNEGAWAEYAQTVYGKRALELSLVTEVIDAYLTICNYNQQIEITENTIDLREDQLELMQSRYDHGLISDLDYKRSKIQLLDAQSLLPRLHQKLRLANNALCILMGISVRDLNITQDLDHLLQPIAITPGLPADLLSKRPDILQTQEAVRSANSQIGVAQALRLPKVSLTGMFGLASDNLFSFNTLHPVVGKGGLDLFGPIFNYKRNKMNVSLAEEITHSVKVEYEQTVLNALKEVEDALVKIENLNELTSVSQEQLGESTEVRDLALERYFGGLDDYDSAINTQQDCFGLELDLAEQHLDLLLAYVEFYKSLGGSWKEETELEYHMKKHEVLPHK